MTANEYLATIVVEETGELATELGLLTTAAAKVLRSGQDSSLMDGKTNLEAFRKEFLDVVASGVIFLEKTGYPLTADETREAIEKKKEKILAYAQASIELGVLDPVKPSDLV